jgi:hypothetical protein
LFQHCEPQEALYGELTQGRRRPEATMRSGDQFSRVAETSVHHLLHRTGGQASGCGLAMADPSMGKGEFTGRLQVTGKDNKLM